MTEPQFRFEDGAGYERMMGVWSQLAGAILIEWLAQRAGLDWIDVGCGSGAFTERLVERFAPAEVLGSIPPVRSWHSRRRGKPRVAQFDQGDAMALGFWRCG